MCDAQDRFRASYLHVELRNMLDSGGSDEAYLRITNLRRSLMLMRLVKRVSRSMAINVFALLEVLGLPRGGKGRQEGES
jgi:hypothetical protein